MAVLAALILAGLVFGYATGQIAREELEACVRYFVYAAIICTALGIALAKGPVIGSIFFVLGIAAKNSRHLVPIMYFFIGALHTAQTAPVFFLTGFPAGSILLHKKQYKNYVLSAILLFAGLTLKYVVQST